ncbi:MAG: protein translocase subunit SecF [Acidobacteria bacterium]|nr:protein translocase subunit SecF [Acidobacteriota bacterium]
MELFKQTSINWIGKRWWFFGISFGLFAIGVLAYFMRGGLNYGIDFTGGTLVIVKFQQTPDLDRLRDSLKSISATPPLIQTFEEPSRNKIQIRMQTALGVEKSSAEGSGESVSNSLRQVFDPENMGSKQLDFNNVGSDALNKSLLEKDPDNLRNQNKTTQEIEDYYTKLAQSLLNFRNKTSDGLVPSLDSLKNAPGVSDAVIASLQKDYYAGPFAILGNESIGAVAGSDLRRKATLAIGLSFLGMLVYIGFRFKPIYGVAAIIAIIHDVAITLGLFALTQKEISLTVIAALLTLVGYSVNDTIVIFDRVRENLRLMRKESLFKILNLSINQTLSRTIMTSGFTFLAVFSLFLFGGEVLNGFSFALTIGIIVGSYSTIALASTIVEWWYRVTEQRSRA